MILAGSREPLKVMKLSMEFALTSSSTEEHHTAGYTLRYALIFFGRSSVISTARLLWIRPVILIVLQSDNDWHAGCFPFSNVSVVRDFEQQIDAENKTGERG